MDSVLDQEGAATLSNIRIQREIKANGGGNIGIAGTMGPHYEAIYDQYMNGEIDEATARKKIGDIFANNERTSGSGGTQTYRQHYETLYDEWARQRR
jgi:type VI secretion system secreted protein VgrG